MAAPTLVAPPAGLQVLKASPSPGDLHVNALLTNISIAYMQDAMNFVADQAAPIVPVNKKTDLYPTFARDFFNRDQMAKRKGGASAAIADYDISTSAYVAYTWALKVLIDDEMRDNADSVYDLDRQATMLLTQQMLINKERQWAANFFTTGKWGTDRTGTSGSPGSTEFRSWNDYANSDPIKDIAGGMETVGKTGFLPNTLVLGWSSWRYLKDHPQIVDRINRGQTTGPARATLAAVAEVLELERILVSRGVYVSTAEGASTQTDAYIAGDNALLCHVAPNPGKMIPSAMYTFSWRRRGAGANGSRIKRYRNEDAESDVIEAQHSYAQTLTGSALGYFFYNTVI